MKRGSRAGSRVLKNGLAVLGLLSLPALGGGLPDALELRYSVHYSRIYLGSVVKTLTRKGDIFHLASATHPTGIAKAFADETIREEGRFRLNDHTLFPLFYRRTRDGRKPYVRTATFDWPRNILTFGDGRQIKLPPGTQDSGSLLFALMLAPLNDGTQQEIHVTDGKRLSRYTIINAGEEKLGTPIGDLATVRLQRRNQKETVTIWLATAKHNLPVKIVKKRAGKPTTTLLIESLSGL